MSNVKVKWTEAKRDVLSALNIEAEARALGVEFTASKPTAKGWLVCRGRFLDGGRVDNNASAGINVSEGPFIGRYKDFGSGGKTINFFDFAVQCGRYPDYKTALKHYAQQTGVKLPSDDEELLTDRLELYDVTAGMLLLYSDGKPGVTFDSLVKCGVHGARWPKGLMAEKTNHLLAFPMYGPALLDLEPVGWHCVAANPKYKIRKFQGQGREEALIKTMSLGEVGLMGMVGAIDDADVINVMEGISDLLCGIGILPDGSKHAFISAGACSCHPKQEWIQRFAGKEIRVWFDVGDKDNAGQIGAAVWAAMCAPMAKTVRNVQLPLGPDGGKNDFRAWVTSGERNYDDVCAYAETFDPIESGQAEATMSPHEAILNHLGLMVLGEHEGTSKVEVYSDEIKKQSTINDINRVSITNLIQMCGPTKVEEYVHSGKEAMPGKYQITDVRMAIAAVGCNRSYSPEDKLGAGVWETDGKIVLVKALEALVISRDGAKVERTAVPFINRSMLDLSRATGDWVDFGELTRYLNEARSQEWCRQVFREVEDVFSKWNWKYKSSPSVVTSLIACTWIQSIWDWRPLVAIAGDSDTGKSLIMDAVLHRGIFGPISVFCMKPTEAAIRQEMKHHGRVLLLDEFEADSNRQKVLELFRTSSRGGKTLRGTADHRGARFGLKNIVWVSSIETGLRKQADRNRFIMLELNEIPKHQHGRIDLPSESQLRELGIKLLAVALIHHQEARRLAALLKGRPVSGVPGRCLESFSVPIGMLSAILGLNDDAAFKYMSDVVGEWDFSGQSSHDKADIIAEIFASEVFLAPGRCRTVDQVLFQSERAVRDSGDFSEALERKGIRRVNKQRGMGRVIFFCCDTICKNLLRMNSELSVGDLSQQLLRIKGAIPDSQRMGGGILFRGISIPEQSIRELFAESSGSAHEKDDADSDGQLNSSSLDGESAPNNSPSIRQEPLQCFGSLQPNATVSATVTS